MHTKSMNRPHREGHRLWPPPGPPPRRAATSVAGSAGNSPGWLRSDAGEARRIAACGWHPDTEVAVRDPRRHALGTAEGVTP
jgi:hypothetical protein